MPSFINYKQVTNIAAQDYAIPEIDVAVFEDIHIEHQPAIIPDVSYCHRVILENIDISANIFKKLFYNTSTTTPTYNTLTNSYTDHLFGLLTAPGATDVSYNVYGFPNGVLYYADMAKYISLLPPARKKHETGEGFSLIDEILDNIVFDMKSVYPTFLELFNTCSFIDFNKEMTNIKTLNDIIPSATVSADCALNWNNILELVRAEYDEYDDDGNNQWTETNALAILKLTLVIKTTLNLQAMGVSDLVSTTEVVLRYKMNFSETEEFQSLGSITK
jgi:hypothetical protein